MMKMERGGAGEGGKYHIVGFIFIVTHTDV
jgi:hypothetical protein